LSLFSALNLKVPDTVLIPASYSVIIIWPSPIPDPVSNVIVPSLSAEHTLLFGSLFPKYR
jgi:hypothetical protein